MPWAKLDDGLWCNPKITATSTAAVGLYAKAISYCAFNLTDGYVPAEVIPYLAGDANGVVDELVAHRLVRRRRGGFVIPDYLDYNPSRETVLEGRRKSTERQAKHRQSREASRRD